jgi:hypothetical protein
LTAHPLFLYKWIGLVRIGTGPKSKDRETPISINSVEIIEKTLDFVGESTEYVLSGPGTCAGTTSRDGTGDRDLERWHEPLFPLLLLLTPTSPCASGGPGTVSVAVALIAPKTR